MYLFTIYRFRDYACPVTQWEAPTARQALEEVRPFDGLCVQGA